MLALIPSLPRGLGPGGQWPHPRRKALGGRHLVHRLGQGKPPALLFQTSAGQCIKPVITRPAPVARESKREVKAAPGEMRILRPTTGNSVERRQRYHLK